MTGTMDIASMDVAAFAALCRARWLEVPEDRLAGLQANVATILAQAAALDAQAPATAEPSGLFRAPRRDGD